MEFSPKLKKKLKKKYTRGARTQGSPGTHRGRGGTISEKKYFLLMGKVNLVADTQSRTIRSKSLYWKQGKYTTLGEEERKKILNNGQNTALMKPPLHLTISSIDFKSMEFNRTQHNSITL